MSNIPNAFTQLASIDLRYALTDIEMDGDIDRESIVRALDRIRQAETSLRLVLMELDAAPNQPVVETKVA